MAQTGGFEFTVNRKKKINKAAAVNLCFDLKHSPVSLFFEGFFFFAQMLIIEGIEV